MANKEQLIAHFDRLGVIIRCTLMKRALHSVNPKPELFFWKLLYGVLLDVAVLEWCKVFGADSEPTHWKSIVPDHDAFRQDLLEHLEVSEEVWREYWQGMKAYRDSQVAHNFTNPEVTHYPSLDLALRSSYFYFDLVIAQLRELGEQRFTDDVRGYGDRFLSQARGTAERALAATSEIRERVY